MAGDPQDRSPRFAQNSLTVGDSYQTYITPDRTQSDAPIARTHCLSGRACHCTRSGCMLACTTLTQAQHALAAMSTIFAAMLHVAQSYAHTPCCAHAACFRAAKPIIGSPTHPAPRIEHSLSVAVHVRLREGAQRARVGCQRRACVRAQSGQRADPGGSTDINL